MDRSNYSRFSDSEDATEWNEKIFKNGMSARLNNLGLNECPNEYNEWERKSWTAGWCDQDMINLTEGDGLHPHPRLSTPEF